MTKERSSALEVVTVTLNPAIDRTVTIPNFTAGVVNRVETVRSNPGGKGVNVATSLADYGHRVAATGFLGKDNPASFEALFSGKNIEDQFIRIAGQTRVGIKVADPVLNQTTDINFPGAAPSASDCEKLNERIKHLDADCFVVAGSVPPGVEGNIYAGIITELKAAGRRVVLDTSGEPLRHALDSKPHVIKPNIHELEALLGGALTDIRAVVSAARHLISTGIETVVVSMGAEGACFVQANEAVIAIPPNVEVRSTVGAGDAMVAGLVSAQFRRLSLADSARIATAFALHALTKKSDDVDAVTSIQSFASQVHIQSKL